MRIRIEDPFFEIATRKIGIKGGFGFKSSPNILHVYLSDCCAIIHGNEGLQRYINVPHSYISANDADSYELRDCTTLILLGPDLDVKKPCSVKVNTSLPDKEDK
jgi:hypothetical protein